MSSVIVTNVAGPRHPLRVAGTTVTHLSFWVPTSGPIGVGISLVSYANDLTVGVMADRLVVPEINEVVALLEEELTRVMGRL